MKEVARFWGKVNSLGVYGQPAKVTLKDLSNNAVCNTDGDRDRLIACGIGEGDEFEIIVTESGNRTSSEMKRIMPPVINNSSI